MIARLFVRWDQLRNSLWALPVAVAIAAAAVAVVALSLKLSAGSDPVWWLYSGNAASASGFLSSLLTAMITMATLAISITMVVLTLAAQSLGPRLIPIFMGDTRTKLTLGLFVGTVVYLLIVLRTVVSAGEDADTVPQLAVTIGTTLVVSSVVLLVFFVHHLARSIVADTIIDRVGDALDSFTSALPAKKDGAGDSAFNPDQLPTGTIVTSARSGYLQLIDFETIVREAEHADTNVVIAHRPGQFVVAGEALAHMTSANAAGDMAKCVLGSIEIGNGRTAVQDIEYSIRQLVEIALRALSSGINDPFTACAVIDRLANSLARIMERSLPQSVFRDEKGIVRVYAPQADFEGIADVAFNQIRQAGAEQPAIMIRLADRLGQLLGVADTRQSAVLRVHLERVRETGARAIADVSDRKALDARIASAFQVPAHALSRT